MSTEREMRAVDEAERSILVAVMMGHADELEDATISGRDFRDGLRGDLWDGMRAMKLRGSAIDPISVADAYPKLSQMLWDLVGGVTYAALHPGWEGVIAKAGLRRRLTAAAAGIAGLGEEWSAAELLDRARAYVDDAAGGETSKVRFVADILPEVLARLDEKPDSLFVESPWRTLNAAIGGFRPGAVYVVAARPGVGKTVIAAQVAAALASFGNVAFSSLEMSEHELVSRLISERLAIMVGKVKDARLTDRDWQLIAQGREELSRLRIAIDDRSGVGPTDVRHFVRSVSRQDGGLAGVVVDYMQLMSSRGAAPRQEQVAEFSRSLKVIAKDFAVPVIALSQLNRAVEDRASNTPRLSDLRESGAIEQDADVVMLLRREGEYPNEHLIIDVAKNRHGETGEVDLAWQGEFSRAVEWGF